MVTNPLRLIGAMQRKDRKNGQGQVPLAISDVSGKSFPGVALDARNARASAGGDEVFSFRRQQSFIACKVKTCFSRAYFFEANPTVEMHGA